MFTSFDKAIAAILSGFLFVAANFGFDLGLSDEFVASVSAVIAGVAAYFTPNKGASQSS